jgi:putative membrane protein
VVAVVVVASPPALLVVVGVGTAYAFGRDRWRRAARRQMVGPATATLFFAGLATVAIALASPLDLSADTSLPAHMVQHVLLLAVAGPLLAFGMPLPTLLWALPARTRRRSVAFTRVLARAHDRRFATWIVAALAAEALVMWCWHIPVAYESAVRIPAVHALEHASYLLVSTAAWWSVTTGRRSLRGAAAIAALFGSLPGMALGVAMVLAPHPWYPTYASAHAADALSSQQLAGVIMWGFGGMAAVVCGVVLFASWLAGSAPEPSVRIPAAATRVGTAP